MKSEREKTIYFERLVKVRLETAPAQRERLSRVLTRAEFAREYDHDARDTRVDLVGQLTDSPDDWCAAQCKLYATGIVSDANRYAVETAGGLA